MKKLKKLLKFKLSLPTGWWVIVLSIIIAIVADYYFFSNNLQISDFDAMSRLNISRKIVDNLTPGLGQLGNVWGPLPQLLMLPFVIFEPLWHSGIAGALMSSICFVFSSLFIYLIIKELVKSRLARVFGVLLFMGNVNLLLLQSMAMSELPFIVCMLGATYALLKWAKNPTNSMLWLSTAGVFITGMTLTRYEGYAFAAAAVLVVGIVTYMREKNLKTVEGVVVLFGTIACLGMFLWSLYLGVIFHDPLYFVHIYSHTKSIISSDVKTQQTFVDQSTAKQLNVPYLVAQYGLSIAYMGGIPIVALAVLALFAYLIISKPWKNVEPYIVLLPISIIGFMIITLARGSIPVTVPDLNLHSFMNFNTNYAFEYNMRYGLLIWPLIVILLAYVFAQQFVLKILAVVILIISLVLPFYKGAFLIYQLPLKWATGSATTKSEDQATDWLKTNYDGGLILISALKHDPTMFRLDLPYKDFIHEGTGKYWLTSRTHPEKYATWIYMSDPVNILGGLGGEEDSVSKYLQYDKTLSTYFDEKYNDGVIAIFKRRQGATPTTTHIFSPWQVKSVDTMKLSRDVAQQWLDTGNPTTAEIIESLKQIKAMGANYVAIDTPYDEKFYSYLKLWSDNAHQLGLHVWFRGNWSAWEGWFNFPKNMTRTEHIQDTYAFIKAHPDLFENFDSFTACPECENGGPGDPRATGDKAGYDQFLVDLNNASQKAFNEIGKSVYSNWDSMNGDVAKQILDQNTVNNLGGIVTIDHYVGPKAMKADVTYLAKKFNAKIFIGEWGSDGKSPTGTNVYTQQAQDLSQILQTLSGLGNNVMGINYWVNVGGPTALYTDLNQPKPAVNVLTQYFTPQQFTGTVVDEARKPIAGVRISYTIKPNFTDSKGNFAINAKPQSSTYTFFKKDYNQKSITLDFSKSNPNGHIIMLYKEKPISSKLRFINYIISSIVGFMNTSLPSYIRNLFHTFRL